MNKNDIVQHKSKNGRKGIVERIDNRSYSIPLIIWRDFEGNSCANLESELIVINMKGGK